MKKGVIYSLVDPRTGVPRYIGKTVHLRSRLNHHVSRAVDSSPRGEWIRELKANGLRPTAVVLAEAESAEHLNVLEEWHIRTGIESGLPLLNVCRSQQTRERDPNDDTNGDIVSIIHVGLDEETDRALKKLEAAFGEGVGRGRTSIAVRRALLLAAAKLRKD
jgi:hypothetical protein